MKECSGFDSHMAKTVLPALQARKTPQQERSVATVEAIYEAAIQVLLMDGPERLTTVTVARRAGVSVGTLYQYFPNKQALLFGVIERHLESTVVAVEAACAANHFEPLATMVDALVNRFIDAKLVDRDTSVALYRVAADVGAAKILESFRGRFVAAILAMLQTARMPAAADLGYMVNMIYMVMAGALRGHMESSAPLRQTAKLREHLAKLVLAYCEAS